MTPGHPVASGAGYDCACGECLFRRAWVEAGLAPDQAGAWVEAGFATPTASAEWAAIGIGTAVVAQEWIDAGFTAETAAGWVEIEDMTPSAAIEAVNTGLAPVDIERVRRADPGRLQLPAPAVAEPGMGIWR